MSGRNGVAWGRWRGPVAAALALVLLLSACGRPTPTPQPVTITFACLDEELSYYETQAHAFHERYPNIVVKLLPQRSLALKALASGESDAFSVSLPFEPSAERGALLSLDRWLTDRDDFYPYALAPFTRDGQTWALPIGVDPVLMYYNRKLFDARQVAYPKPGWTWDDLLDTAGELRDYGEGIYGYGAGLWLEEPLLFVLQNGGRLADDWQQPTRATFDDPQTVQALQWYAALVFQHDVAPNAYEVREVLGERGLYGGILDGKVAMWAGYYSARVDPSGRYALDCGVVELPRGRERATLARVEGVAISAQAAHPELCWQWADFLSRQASLHMAPARRSVAKSRAFADKVGASLAAATRASLEYAVVLPQAPAGFYQEVNTLWAEALDAILNARLDTFHALQQAQRKAGRP